MTRWTARPLGRATGAAALLALAGLATLGGPAGAASDATPPTMATPVKASFVVGSQLGTDERPDCADPTPGMVWVSARQTFHWRGADDSGSVRYRVTENTKGVGSYEVVDDSAATELTTTTTNANQGCGGGSWMPASWDVTAVDPTGNETTRVVSGGLFTLTQDTGAADDSFYAAPVSVSYRGSWATSRCGCWSDGTTHKTTARGAKAILTVTVPDGERSHLGLVMAGGPDRGAARVRLDGRTVARVGTWSAEPTSRTVVWQSALRPGRHTVQVVNEGTADHPRIDLDAVLTN